MKVGSLFSGIGGFDLGLERAGMEVVWQVEIDDFCTRVLEKHWPNVERFRDVRDVGKHNLAPVDLICGGFPCQDIAKCGKRGGIEGEKSGFWGEFARIVGELRPPYVFVENTPSLLVRGAGRVLGDLAEFGYDAEWRVLSAAELGAPHIRERLFLLAHTRGVGNRLPQGSICAGREAPKPSSWWNTEPDVGRVADGVPDQVDRLRGLGNANLPQIAEWIGRRILAHERGKE
jgi:DNA (cytosine-5)-methyltransferase 1